MGPCAPAFSTVEGAQKRFSSFRKQAQHAPPTAQGPELSRDWRSRGVGTVAWVLPT